MAKGKKSRTQYVSKGERRNVAKPNCTPNRDPLQRLINQREAWAAGKNVIVTIPNPDPDARNMPYIRVKGKDIWGDPKRPKKAPEAKPAGV